MNTRAAIFFIHGTLSRPLLQNHYSLMKIFLIGQCSFNHQGKIKFSESTKVRVVIFVCDTSSRPLCHNCKVL